MNETQQFQSKKISLLVKAPAKLNLSLLISGKRPDGFHEIETIMTPIDLFDHLLLQTTEQPGIKIQVNGPYWAPDGPENHIYPACERLLELKGIKPHIKITLTKNIPAGSGLGSASSNVAATLTGLNQLLDINAPVQKLKEIAADISSDAPFFVNPSLALCRGKGEKITPINADFDFNALLVLPKINVSTKKVYENYTHNEKIYRELHDQINQLIHKNDITSITKICTNMLEPAAFTAYPELEKLKHKALKHGLDALCLTGSGSAMFEIFDNNRKEKFLELKSILPKNIECDCVLVSNIRW